MSLALFAYPAVTSGEEGCDLAFLNTLLTGRVRAREGRQRTTTELSSTRGQNVYKRGGTRTFPQSPLSQHRQQSLRHVAASYPGGGRIEDLRNRTRDGASYLWRLDLSWTVGRQCKEGGNTEHMRRRHSSRHEAGLTEVNFGVRFTKTKHSYYQ